MLLPLFLAVTTPTPSPTPTAPPLIERVRVATGTPQALHRLPLPASLLDASQLHSNAAPTGDAALRQLPGFDRDRSNSAFTNYGQLRVSFAGAGNDRGVVLVDGIPAQDAFGGQIDWAAYPTNDLTRAELLRGPGSALYGSGAIGGVLSLETIAPSRSSDGTVSISAGTHDALRAYANATAALSSKLSASVAASQQRLSYADFPAAYRGPVDSPAVSRANMVSLRLRYAASNVTVLDYGYRGAWDDQQEGRPNYDFWRNFVQHSAGVVHASPNASVAATLYERNTFVTNRADKPSSPGALLYTQVVPTHEGGAIASWTVDAPHSTFALRADARFVNGVSDQLDAANAIVASGSGVQRLADLAVQNTWRLRRGEVVAGLAGSVIDLPSGTLFAAGKTTSIAPRTDRALSPRLAARYDLTPQLALRASAGTGFRAPFLNELVRGYVIGPVSYLPNPNLVPERSSSISTGFDWSRGGNEVTADFMQTLVSDAIGFRTIDATHQLRSNIAHTQTDGLIATYTHRIDACAKVAAWASAQNARVTAGTPVAIGKRLPYVPSASGGASFDTAAGALHAGVTLAYLGPAFADDLNMQPLGSAITLGVHASLPLDDRVRIAMDVENPTNARYLSSIDRLGPPATISLGLQIPLDRRATRCR